MTLDELNHSQALFDTLIQCCHCQRWARTLADQKPFSSIEELKQKAASIWTTASEQELLEAFSGHPQIGDMKALRNRFAASANREQGQIVDADEEVLLALKRENQMYLDKFGFIFIVCATGKSASEMLALLRARMDNDRATELQNAAIEQGKIMQLRLTKIFESQY